MNNQSTNPPTNPLAGLTLDQLVPMYLQAEKKYNHYSEHNPEPAPPEERFQFESLEDLNAYLAAFKAWDKQKEAWKKDQHNLGLRVIELKKAVADLIPIACVWIKVGPVGVGYYYDHWGASNLCLTIKMWDQCTEPIRIPGYD